MAEILEPRVEAGETKATTVIEASSKMSQTSDNVADIYIDPELEKAALRKFDKWLLPVAFTFLVLSSLDRSNVSATSLVLEKLYLEY